jgi:steroid delta-isomerase-like uncharacterized protein
LGEIEEDFVMRDTGGAETDAPAPSGAMPASRPDRELPLTPEEVTALLTAYLEAINRRDETALAALLAPDSVHHWPFGHDTVGVAADVANLQRVAAVFPDLAVTAGQILAGDDLGVIIWTATGTQRQPFLGFPPSARPATWSGIFVHRLAGGRIAETWTQADHLSRLQQQGAIPALAATPASRA